MRWTSRGICTVLLLSLLSCGGTEGNRPFLMVQTCVQDKAGIARLIEEMKAVAVSRRMRFTDRSEETARELKAVDYPGQERADGSPVINVSVRRDDGMGFSAGNTSLPGYQVALGFSEGSNPSEARELANEVVRRLEQYWTVETVPADSGAMPKPGCR
jgi:hypothetical protein